MARLFVQARQLRAKYRALPFAQTVVGAVDVMAVEPFARHAAAIVDAARLLLERIIAGDDDAAFARSHELAGLKAKRARGPVRSDAAAFPFRGVRVGAIFDQANPFLLGERDQSIEVGGVASHGYADNRVRAPGNGAPVKAAESS